MNQRYTLALTVLLGLAAATEIQTPVALTQLDDYQKVSCFVMDELTFFDLTPLSKD